MQIRIIGGRNSEDLWKFDGDYQDKSMERINLNERIGGAIILLRIQCNFGIQQTIGAHGKLGGVGIFVTTKYTVTIRCIFVLL